MQFFVIYSVDVPAGVNMRPAVPPQCKELWYQTEGDHQYEYSYLEGRWSRGHHRKWVAELEEKDFKEFIRHVDLTPERTETLGSITEFGHLPAINFNGNHPDIIQNAYVTPLATKKELIDLFNEHEIPIPEVLLKDENQQYFWERSELINSNVVWDELKELVIEGLS